MKVAIYPGSFDPITLGHLDVVRRAAKIVDKLIICVMVNAEKNPLFSPAERLSMVQRAVAQYENVEADTADMLLVEYAGQKGADIIIKGLRVISDYERECQMALMNKKINPELDTLFLPAREQYTYLSSSLVKEMAKYGADLSECVPQEIIADIIDKQEALRKSGVRG